MNSPLLFLTDVDFGIQQGTSGMLLANRLSGISLLLFYSPKCPHCNKLLPIFYQLPEKISGCTFALIDVTKSPKLIQMSHQTVVPLTHVPFLILYVNGKPYIQYKGVINLQQILAFIIEVSNSIYRKIPVAKSNVIENKQSIDFYANPLYGEMEVTYLTYDHAYI